MKRNRIIKTASIISITGNSILALSKIITGIMAGSLSVLGDGLDSLIDIFISIITLAVSVIISRPPDGEHPYGHHRAEPIATSLLAFLIFFIGGQLSLSTAQKLFHHEEIFMPDKIAIYVTVISIIGKLLLSWSQRFLGKKSDSAMLMANSRNMQNDVITSCGVLVGLGFIFFFKLPVIDKILAIIIGIWIMISAVRILMGTVTEFMEGENDRDLYLKIFEAVKDTHGASNPHRVRIRRLGVFYTVEMDLEVDGNLKVKEAHRIVHRVETRIRKSIPNIYDVVIHMEPLGHIDNNEPFGLSEDNIHDELL